MMNIYTPADLRVFSTLMGDFRVFAQSVGCDPTDPAITKLQSPTSDVMVSERDRPIVAAWVTWQLSYNTKNKIMWNIRAKDGAIARNDVSNIIEALDPRMSTTIVRKTSNLLEMINGSKLMIAPLSAYAARGTSLNHMVIDGANPSTKQWLTLKLSGIPRLTGKIITIY